jgi:hypothetical protein
MPYPQPEPMMGSMRLTPIAVARDKRKAGNMHASRNELPILFGEDPAAIRGGDWEGLRSMIVSLPAGADVVSLFRGLPNNQCTCPHWGYVLRGRMRVIYDDGEELMQAGDLFYIPAGHVPIIEEDIEFLEFSPPAEHQAVLDVVKHNAAATGAA